MKVVNNILYKCYTTGNLHNIPLKNVLTEKVKSARKSCSGTNTKAALRYRSTTILKLFAPKS